MLCPCSEILRKDWTFKDVLKCKACRGHGKYISQIPSLCTVCLGLGVLLEDCKECKNRRVLPLPRVRKPESNIIMLPVEHKTRDLYFQYNSRLLHIILHNPTPGQWFRCTEYPDLKIGTYAGEPTHHVYPHAQELSLFPITHPSPTLLKFTASHT